MAPSKHRARFVLGAALLALILLPASLQAQKKSDVEACTAAWNARNADVNLAIARLTGVIDANTRSWECFLYRGNIYQGKGEFKKAIADSSRAIDLSQGKAWEPYNVRAAAYLDQQNWEPALADLGSSIARNDKGPIAYFMRATALKGLGRHADALASLDQALVFDAKLPAAQRSAVGLSPAAKASALFTLQKYGEAIQAYDVRLASAGDDVEGHFFRGIAEWKTGQLEKARADAATLSELQPRLQVTFDGDHALEMFDLDARMATAKSAVDAAQAADALQHWPEAFQEWNRAWSYCSSFGEDGPALGVKILAGMAQTYAKLNPKPAPPELARKYSVQAEAYIQDKDLVHAIGAYAKAIGIAPWSPRERFNMALLLESQQQYQAAIDSMQAYLQLVPGADDARAAQDKIYAWQSRLK
jgi:tetratricopeptide (TPR) repeat protein